MLDIFNPIDVYFNLELNSNSNFLDIKIITKITKNKLNKYYLINNKK